MCTVTIIPKGKNDFILTSNRDEAPSRVSIPPNLYNINSVETLFPKDEVSGGTWIGISEKKRIVCVLNGGFDFHKRQSNYRMSRGVVAKDFMIADDIIEIIEDYNLKDIEPFTMVIADWNDSLNFYELVWNGCKKHIIQLPLEPKIWSSSTLYTSDMKEERKQWFEDFKSEYILDTDSVLNFHKTAGYGNNVYGVIMDRGFVKTTSITQVEKNKDALEMHYENLLTQQKAFNVFKTSQAVNG